MNLTRDEFIKMYSGGSKAVLAKFETGAWVAVPCKCGEAGCRGWAAWPKEIYAMRKADGLE